MSLRIRGLIHILSRTSNAGTSAHQTAFFVHHHILWSPPLLWCICHCMQAAECAKVILVSTRLIACLQNNTRQHLRYQPGLEELCCSGGSGSLGSFAMQLLGTLWYPPCAMRLGKGTILALSDSCGLILTCKRFYASNNWRTLLPPTQAEPGLVFFFQPVGHTGSYHQRSGRDTSTSGLFSSAFTYVHVVCFATHVACLT